MHRPPLPSKPPTSGHAGLLLLVTAMGLIAACATGGEGVSLEDDSGAVGVGGANAATGLATTNSSTNVASSSSSSSVNAGVGGAPATSTVSSSQQASSVTNAVASTTGVSASSSSGNPIGAIASAISSALAATSSGSSSSTGGGGMKGSCCTSNSTPGCTDSAIEQCVCAQDAYCCTNLWDSICVGQVDSLNCGSCNMSATSTSSATSTAASSSSTGGSMKGSCCSTSNNPGCADPVVEQCVCAQDPYCCSNKWDSLCVQKVDSLNCGTCNMSTSTGGGGSP